MPITAKILGYLGLIPFIFFPTHELLNLNLITSMQANMGFVQYSAIILSFLVGCIGIKPYASQKTAINYT